MKIHHKMHFMGTDGFQKEKITGIFLGIVFLIFVIVADAYPPAAMGDGTYYAMSGCGGGHGSGYGSGYMQNHMGYRSNDMGNGMGNDINGGMQTGMYTGDGTGYEMTDNHGNHMGETRIVGPVPMSGQMLNRGMNGNDDSSGPEGPRPVSPNADDE